MFVRIPVSSQPHIIAQHAEPQSIATHLPNQQETPRKEEFNLPVDVFAAIWLAKLKSGMFYNILVLFSHKHPNCFDSFHPFLTWSPLPFNIFSYLILYSRSETWGGQDSRGDFRIRNWSWNKDRHNPFWWLVNLTSFKLNPWKPWKLWWCGRVCVLWEKRRKGEKKTVTASFVLCGGGSIKEEWGVFYRCVHSGPDCTALCQGEWSGLAPVTGVIRGILLASPELRRS